MRIAVIGGSGLLGRALCRRLVQDGNSVLSISRSGRPAASQSWHNQLEWHADALGSDASFALLQNIDILYHLASTTIPASSNAQILFDLESNVVSTVRMLEFLRGSNTKIVFTSSGGTVYGRPTTDRIAETHPTNPISAYGVHKLAIEKYLGMYRELYGLPSVILRPANIYGESQDMSKPLGALGHFARKAYDGIPIQIWGDGSTTRDYIHVDDVVLALIRSAEYQGRQHVFNVGSGVGVSLLEIVEAIDAITGRKNAMEFRESRSFDVAVNVLDSTLAAAELGWKAKTNVATGLQRMLASFVAPIPAADSVKI